jgi:hypothetical protein
MDPIVVFVILPGLVVLVFATALAIHHHLKKRKQTANRFSLVEWKHEKKWEHDIDCDGEINESNDPNYDPYPTIELPLVPKGHCAICCHLLFPAKEETGQRLACPRCTPHLVKEFKEVKFVIVGSSGKIWKEI